MTKRFNKAGEPTSHTVAIAIETLRDLLFREYGDEFAFTVVGKGAVIGASYKGPGTSRTTIEAVTR